MEYETCPYCGKKIALNEIHAHMIMEHLNIIEQDEFSILDKMKRQHFDILLDLKRNYPELFIRFIEELSMEEDKKIKIFCMKELISMNEFEKGEKLFNQIISKENEKEVWLEYIIMLNKKGQYEKSIETCKKAMKIFDDDEFIKRMERIIKKARDRL